MTPHQHAPTLRRLFWLSLMLAVSAFPAAATAAGQFRIVAATGQPSGVDDLPLAGGFINFSTAAFDASDRVIVGGGFAAGAGLALGVWFEQAGVLAPSLHNGAAAPGLPAGTVASRLELGTPTVQQGLPSIFTRLTGASYGAYVGGPGAGLRLASHTGKIIDPGSGIEVVNFRGHGSTIAPEPIANADGDVLMYGTLRGGPLGAGGGLAA